MRCKIMVRLWAYLGMQLGGVRSTSQVAKSFMGTGLLELRPIMTPVEPGAVPPAPEESPEAVGGELRDTISPEGAAAGPPMTGPEAGGALCRTCTLVMAGGARAGRGRSCRRWH